MSLSFVFPGQGSQSIGMLASLAAAEPVVRQTFADASDVLGYDLWKLCQEGPEADLNSTERTQPAMLAAGVATWRVWRKRGGAAPTVMSGHSLGEFTALVCADSLDFRTAIELVRFRGNAMQAAVPHGKGAMAAVLGLEDPEVEAACAEAAQGEVVEAVNFNAPLQVVIAGTTAAVDRAIEACKARGAKRTIALPVSVPSHSSLMKPAADRLRERLEQTEVRSPLVPEIYTVDVRKHGHPTGIKAALVQQLFSPVRWAETVRRMIANGATHIVECGPGKVLSGLNRRVERRKEIAVFAIDDSESIDAAVAACWGTQDV
ncbi:MAG TPA: ACP S-malonyltransferase [Steroidobacteraceae bacterium]|nr:ACP S-malonyltransferase [Steroidobacteraceae bacterium]